MLLWVGAHVKGLVGHSLHCCLDQQLTTTGCHMCSLRERRQAKQKNGQCFTVAFDDERLAAQVICYCKAPFLN